MTFGLWAITLGLCAMTFVGSALVTSGLVKMAFLLALRLLIRDFFKIDIACSLLIVFDLHFDLLHSACQSAGGSQFRSSSLKSKAYAETLRGGSIRSLETHLFG